MPIRRRNPRKKVILAGIQGLVIGVVGVLLFGFLLNIANDKKVESKEEVSTPAKVDKEEEKVEVAADPLLTFKAKQYGVFTTKEGAMAFMSTEPSLAKASIVKVANQFYVWGELFVNDTTSGQADTIAGFIKNISVSTQGCENPKINKIITLLQEEKISKNFFDSIVKKEDYPEDLSGIVQAISTFSDLHSVMRLHVFSHYVEQNDCIEMSF